jgi:hypothetical protein
MTPTQPEPAAGVPIEEKLEPISLKEFFENIPPGNERLIEDPLERKANLSVKRDFIRKDVRLDLHCAKCGGTRNFEKITEDESKRDYYLKGRRCENQGLGIGAFGYYRRVVENQKNRIIDEIIRAAKKINAPQEMVDGLEAAKLETQFITAIDRIKPAVPQALLISGHNPLTLLHSALSQGLHAERDEDCLELASSIRTVLADLIERTSAVLRESAELDNAVTRLMQKNSKKSQSDGK